MRINRLVYQEIVNRFEQKVWEEELTDEQKSRWEKPGAYIWNITDPGKKGPNLFTRIFVNEFSNTVIARNHFIRKFDDYSGETIPIKREFFYTILNYLKIAIPENFLKIVYEEQTRILQQIAANLLLKGNDESEEKQEIYNGNWNTFNKDYDRNWTTIQNIIKNYYEHIKSGQYVDALRYWDPTVENRWNWNHFDFGDQFRDLGRINNFNVWSVHVDLEFKFANGFVIYFATTSELEQTRIRVDYISLVKRDLWFVDSVEAIEPNRIFLDDELYHLFNRPIPSRKVID